MIGFLGFLYRIFKFLTQRLHVYFGPPIWCRLIGLILDQTDVHCPNRSPENIYVKYGHRACPSPLKNYTMKGVSGRGLKILFMDDFQKQPRKVNFELGDHSSKKDRLSHVRMWSTDTGDKR